VADTRLGQDRPVPNLPLILLTPPLPARPSLPAARWATRAQFTALGLTVGAWGVHIPSAQARYGLDEGGLAVALLAAALGAVASLMMAGRVVGRWGPRRVALGSGVAMALALGAALHGGSLPGLAALMVIFGAAGAWFDVAINAEGSELEAASGMKVMSGFHAMFSTGGMLAAAAGAALISAGAAPTVQLWGFAATVALLVGVASAFMLPAQPGAPAADGFHESGWRLPRGTLAVLGGLGAVGLLAEGAMYDWGVLYLQAEAGASATVAALGYAAFSAAMAGMRFAGDALRARFAPAALLAASAWVAALALAAVLLLRDPIVALVGFALVGAGFANVVPILFMAATRVPGVAPAAAIAMVSSVGYLGFLIGPALVGGVARATSLSWGLGVVVLAALLLAAGARRLPR